MRLLLLALLVPITLFAEVGYVEPWGKDSQLLEKSQNEKIAKLSLMGKVAQTTILFHQKVLTHISGPRSSYRPTSSEYMLQAIRANGFWKGYFMGCDRLLRENGDPWVYRTKMIHGKLYKWDPPEGT